MAKKKDKYGSVNKPADITKINRDIRKKIKTAKSQAALTKFVRESGYLITLTYSPAWKKHLKGQLLKVRTEARKQYCTTATLANSRAKKVKGAEPIYSKNVC